MGFVCAVDFKGDVVIPWLLSSDVMSRVDELTASGCVVQVMGGGVDVSEFVWCIFC